MAKSLNTHKHVWLPKEGAVQTVVALHGTGGDENDLVPLVQGLYPEANILGIRGNVTENGYPRFFRRFAEGMFDVADIRVRANDLVGFFEAAVAEYRIVPGAATWLGYSNGANMIGALLLLDDVVRDAVLLRAQDPKLGPVKGFGKAGLKAQVKLLSGEYDTIVPRTESVKLRDALMGRGHEVEQHFLATGHQLSHFDVDLLGVAE